MPTFQLSSFAMIKKAPAELVTLRLFGGELAARDYFPLLRWMIFTGVTLFGFAIAWRYRLFQLMTAQDQSGISMFICLLYVAISGHCLASIIAVSREINTAHRVRDRVINGVTAYRAEGRRVVIDNGDNHVRLRHWILLRASEV